MEKNCCGGHTSQNLLFRCFVFWAISGKSYCLFGNIWYCCFNISCLFRLSFQPSWILGQWSWWRMRRCQKLVPIVFQGRQQNCIWCQYYLTRMPFMLVSTNFRWPVASSQLFFLHPLFSAWYLRFRVPNLGLGFKMFSFQLL